MTLLQLAFLMFAAGACGGVLFVVLGVLKVRYPRWFGAGHGLLGLVACGVLGKAVFLSEAPVPPQATWALAVFVAALLGGVTLFRLLAVQRGRLLLALGHGGLALVGLYLLYGVAY